MKAADLSDDTLNHGTRYPKRRQVIPTFSAEPKQNPVPKAIHKSTSHANTVLVDQSSLGSSGVTQTTLSDRLAQWELKVENRLADRFREFETKQQTRLQELEERMQQTVDRLLDAATEKFQSTVQKQLNHAAENMEKFQNLILDQFKALRPNFPPQ